jgi:hypothetical protein
MSPRLFKAKVTNSRPMTTAQSLVRCGVGLGRVGRIQWLVGPDRHAASIICGISIIGSLPVWSCPRMIGDVQEHDIYFSSSRVPKNTAGCKPQSDVSVIACVFIDDAVLGQMCGYKAFVERYLRPREGDIHSRHWLCDASQHIATCLH